MQFCMVRFFIHLCKQPSTWKDVHVLPPARLLDLQLCFKMYFKKYKMNGFLACDISKQIVGSKKEIKINTFYSFGIFSIKLDKVLLSKYMCIFLVSQVIARDVKPMFVTFFVDTEFRMVNLETC